MSELLIYDNYVETKFYLELFFVGINPPVSNLNPILGPNILRSRLEREREVRKEDPIDYIIPINLLDAASKSYAEVIKLDFVELKNGIMWEMTLCFEFVEDVSEFFHLINLYLGILRSRIYANYYIHLQFEGKEDIIEKVDEDYLVDLGEFSKRCNKFACKEKNKENANLLFLLDYIFSEAKEGGGELVDYCKEIGEFDKNHCTMDFVFNFDKLDQFKNFAKVLVSEDRHTSNGMLS